MDGMIFQLVKNNDQVSPQVFLSRPTKTQQFQGFGEFWETSLTQNAQLSWGICWFLEISEF